MTKMIITELPMISDTDNVYYLGVIDDKVLLYLRPSKSNQLISIKEIPEGDTIYNYIK